LQRDTTAMPSSSSFLKPLLKLMARTSLPKTDGELRLSGLHAPVEVLRDRWGVPHIYAENVHDLFFAQGYIQAQERLFQMDFNRRMVAGRLSEVLGAVTIPLDRWMRVLTMRRVAESEVKLLEGEGRDFLQAYANGINAFVARGRLPLEFTLLRYKPEPWILADTLAWIKMMSWSLSVNWEMEILRAQLIARLGPELAAELDPPHLQRWPFVLPPDSDYSYIGAVALERARAARPFAGPSPYEGLGSNNWVLSGSRTIDGMPLLASDMHLALTAPAIWFENHLVCEGIDATGVTFPGIPGVIAGYNGHVAWCYTNGFIDVQDLYMEHLRRTQDGRVQAEYNGNWEDVRILHETIQVKGQSPVVEEVIITRHGPIINALAPDFTGEQPLALRWVSLDPDTMSTVLLEMLRAKDVQALHNAFCHWTAPNQNMVCADQQGNIGYTLVGKIPVRAKGSGRVPVPGWTDEYEWVGYLPFDALPHSINPPQGYIATANNRTVSDDYPVRLEMEPITGDRAQRIHELILDSSLRSGEEKIDIPFIQRMHFDQVSTSARLVARYLGRLPLSQSAHYPETELHEAVKLIKEWDGRLTEDSPAAAIYEAFIRKMAGLMIRAKLDERRPPGETASGRRPSGRKTAGQTASVPTEVTSLAERVMGKGPVPVLAETSSFGDRWLPWLTELLPNPDSQWFDLGHGEKRDEVMQMALQAALDELKKRLGADMKKWRWGKLHPLTFQHVLQANPLMANLFNVGPFPVGGDNTTVWAACGFYHSLEPAGMVGPPFRMIVDLGDFGKSLGLLAPGQSGNPASAHYADQAKAWFTSGYHSLLYQREEIKRRSKHRLKLTPRRS
jgi:penicillin amidase